jgi:uncharacterized protein YyaL (SSP411 family)
VSASNLVFLGEALGRPEYLERAEKTIACFAAMMNESPAAMPRMVLSWIALSEARDRSRDAETAKP